MSKMSRVLYSPVTAKPSLGFIANKPASIRVLSHGMRSSILLDSQRVDAPSKTFVDIKLKPEPAVIKRSSNDRKMLLFIGLSCLNGRTSVSKFFESIE